MYAVNQEYEAVLEVKQSKFLAFVLPMENLGKRLDALKVLHPKARHYVVAWRKINEYEQVVEYSTDDGEPKGTAGRPVLNVLRGEDLINSAVIIVRYFGGTKLGTGGMVRAYSDAAKQVLQEAKLMSFEIRKLIEVSVAYHLNQRFKHYIESHSLRVTQTEFANDQVVYELYVTKQERQSLEEYVLSEHIINIKH